LIAAVASVVTLALASRYNAHPDELAHVAAFDYFGGRVWPPDLNSDDVPYSVYGWSRVYTGEFVYLLLGNARALGELAFRIDRPHLAYRLANVGLLVATLAFVAIRANPLVSRPALLLFLIALPQLLYVFGYANSDAWGVAFSIILFWFALELYGRGPRDWRLRDMLVFGVLSTALILAKPNFLVALVLPWLLLLGGLFRPTRSLPVDRTRIPRTTSARRIGLFTLALGVALLGATPLKLVYPWSQGDWAHRVEEMRELRAAEGFKPSAPTYPGLMLATKGAGYTDLIRERRFFPC
jgi:hypothetical protein